MVDLHIHTSFSPDAHLPPERACRAAVARGIKIAGFADHVEFLPADEAYVDLIDSTKIHAEITRLREMYQGKLEILYGAEIGFIPGKESQIKDFLDSQPLDYAVGSVHYVDGVLVSRWVCEREVRGTDFTPYFETLLAAAESGLFDVLGHLDYIRKYLFAPQRYRREEYAEIIGRILEATARQGLIIELNTSGWRHATGEPYPGEGILKRFAELGGWVTFGSDAHKYYEVGYAAGKAKDLLRGAGFGSVEVFREHKRSSIPL